MTAPNPRRRLRYRPRTLVITATIVCVLIGLTALVIWYLARARENGRLWQEARAKIESLSTRKPPNVPPDQWRRAVEWTANVVVQIYSVHVFDDPEEIKRLCESLDQKFAGQVDLTTLQWVWEQCEDEDDERHDAAIRFRDVRLLTVGPITDDRLPELWSIDKCVSLDLSGTQITDAGLEHIKGLTNLGSLNLGGTQISDVGLDHLSALPNLQHLWLDDAQITDVGVEQLGTMTHLSILSLGGTQISDAGLKHLTALTNVEYLDLRNTQVSHEGVAELQRALPNCRIKH